MLPVISFYVFAALLIYFAFKVVTSTNPLHCALYLVLTMLGLAAAYFNLNAQFIAGVQVIVYAGAVMVLFVMVLMLFDLQQELRAFAKGLVSGSLKLISAAVLAGVLVNAASQAIGTLEPNQKTATLAASSAITRDLSLLLYTKYMVIFQVLGVLLLVVAVGVVAVSRVRGGTHASHE